MQPIIWKAGKWELWVDGKTGELLRLAVQGQPVVQGPQRSFDFKANGEWQGDQYGLDFVQAQADEQWLELTFDVGETYNPHPVPDAAVQSSGLKRRRKFRAQLRWTYDPQDEALHRTVQVRYLDAAARASGKAPRFEGFSFSLGPISLGEPEDCEMAMPTSVRPETLARPRIPYAQAASEPFACGSAPDGDPGLFILHNRAHNAVLASWMETMETCYETRSLGFDGGPHLYFFEKYENRLTEDPCVRSHAQVLFWLEGTPQTAMRRYAQYIQRVSPPLTGQPAWLRNAVFMEVDTEYLGGFNGLAEQLPRLRKMGINALYLLPINVGTYAIEAHERINPALGTEEELISMVRKAHALGMHVLLDLLIVILTRDSRLAREHPEYFVRDAQGRLLPHEAWGNVSTDYGNPEYQEYIVEFARHCVRDWEVDGFRVDAASYKIPMWCALDRPPYATSFGAYPLLEKVSAAMKQINPDAVLLNEIAGPAFYHDCDISHNFGFVYCLMGEKAKAMPYTLRDYRQYLSDGQACLPAGAKRVFYTRNHDTAWFYRFDGYSDEFFSFEAIHALIDGIPLIFSGQNGQPQWAGPDEKWAAFYQKLYAIREKYPVLLEGECRYEAVEADDERIFCVLRTLGDARAIVVISGAPQPLSIRLSLCDPSLAQYANGIGKDAWTEGDTATICDGQMELQVPPYGIQIWLLEKERR